MEALWVLAIMSGLAVWLWITLVMVSVMRCLVPQDSSLPTWVHPVVRILVALFLGVSGALLAARWALPLHMQAGLAVGGIAMGLLVYVFWRMTMRRYEQKHR